MIQSEIHQHYDELFLISIPSRNLVDILKEQRSGENM